MCVNGAVVTIHIEKEVDDKEICNVIILKEKFMDIKIKAGKMFNIEIKKKVLVYHLKR